MQCHTIAQSLTRLLANRQKVHVLDYRETFSALWAGASSGKLVIKGKALDLSDSETVMLIVGHTPPEQLGLPQCVGNLNYRDHFSAFSWAAAFRLQNPKLAPMIIILQDIGDSLLKGAAEDLRGLFVHAVHEASGFVPGIRCLAQPFLAAILAAFSSDGYAPISKGQQAMLRGIIQQHLVPDPDDHHHLGNIVGGLMLAPPANTSEPGEVALRGLLRALQPATGFQRGPEALTLDEQLKKILAKGVRVILFDDMGELWRPFIQQWVPDGFLHVPFVTESSLANLVERLKTLCSQPLQKRRLNASDFGVANVADGEAFILLLDLRLFAAGSSSDEVRFIDKLKTLAADVAKAGYLKWPAVSEEEAKKVEEARYLKAPNAPYYRKARSWLPRLISLIDPTLPIITFSSTQDPEILQEFRAYGNILTDFAKPAFRGVLGEADEWIGAAHYSFGKAMRNALRISSAQAKMRKVNAPWVVPSSKAVSAGTSSQVEIFIDESGRASEDRFAIGAVILISGAAVFDHVRYRNGSLTGNNRVGLWGIDDIIKFTAIDKFPPPELRLRKGERLSVGTDEEGTNHNAALNATLAKMEKLVAEQGAMLLACSLLSEEPPDVRNIASLKHPVHRYRDILGRLLESVLLHCDPVRDAIDSGARIAVDAATAANPASNWNQPAMHQSFGTSFFSTDEGPFCVTFSHDDLLPLLTGLLMRNNRENLLRNVVRARAAKLFDWEKCIKERKGDGREKEWQKLPPKPLHYLADWIAHFTLDPDKWREVPEIPILKKLFEYGFRQMDSQELRDLLRCHCKWGQRARAEAVRDRASISYESAPEMPFALTRRLKAKAARWMEDFGADDLTSLFHSANPLSSE